MVAAIARCLAPGLCIVLVGCGSTAAPKPAPPHRSRTTAAVVAAPTQTAAPARSARPVRPPRPRRPRISPGSLPQTSARPSSATDEFRRQMQALWQGIRRDSLATARPAFFPEAAYAQLKAIGDPSADYRWRLLVDYELDIGAAHAVLGTHAASAHFLRVDVPDTYAHWVPTGVCENSVGYYELPNSRIVYREDGQISSLGIASLISWRGVWYVIHLGAVDRSTGSGVVDDPQSGPGTAVYSGTC
ncbi:MAG TPA: hypothetical protein VG295_03370 [Solirubrobacteraceae bacterium]|nr:hypothetical protein [Solirubrobacteraceae bacterium]